VLTWENFAMRAQLKLLTATLLAFCTQTIAAQETNLVWRIGAADKDYHELSFNPDQNTWPRQFPQGVQFTVGKSDPAKEFSAIHPGPADAWAQHREHVFKIAFTLDGPITGAYLLGIDIVDTHAAAPPTLRVLLNGQKAEVALEPGAGDISLVDPSKGRNRTLRFTLGPDCLKSGENVLEIRNLRGSWLLYDTLFLQQITADAASLPLEVSLRPTLFFVERDGKLLQEFQLRVNGLASAGPAKVEIQADGATLTAQELGKPELGALSQALYLPETEKPRELTAIVTASHQTKTLIIQQKPQRKWRIYVAPATHTDIGYTDLQERVVALHNRNTDLALELAREYPLFHWNLESSWAAQMWFRDRPPSRHDELLEAARRKRVGIESGYLNMLTGLCTEEELIRDLYYSARLHREAGVPFESHTLTDAPSHVWTLPTILAGAGIRCLSVGVNQTRAPLFKKNIHLKSPFWWVGPDGSKVLTWFTDGYSQAERIGLKDGPERLRAATENFLNWWQNRTDYPYDAVLLHGAYTDNVAIGRGIAETITEYHKRYAYPQVIMSANNEFFEYIEKNFADKIQTVRGCGGSWWEDGAASSAVETAINRNTHQDAIAAEVAWAVARLANPSAGTPQDEFNRMWDCILLYDEHTWGAYNSIWTPHSDFVTRQFAYKAAFATEAADRAKRLLDRGLRQLAARVNAPANTVLVFNPSGRPRSGMVLVDIPRGQAVVDEKGPLPQQVVRQDALETVTVNFIAREVPAAGYKVYRLAPAEKRETPKRFNGKVLENDFYRVEFAPVGGIASLVDKKLGKELVDKSSKYTLGQVIYAAGGSDPEGKTPIEAPILSRVKYHTTTQADIRPGPAGPLFASAKSISKLPPIQRAELEVILYEQERRIDFVYQLQKDMILEKEAVYFAFPFAGAKPQFRYEIGGGSVRPNEDHFPGACRDWFAVQRWVTVHTEDAAVAWSAVDTPLITLCDLTPGKWLEELPVTNGTIFAYVMNNYWFTNYKAGQDGAFTFRYSLTSDQTIDPASASMFGEAVHAPMRAVRIDTGQGGQGLPPALSFCQVSPANVEMTTLKPADDGKGLIVRIRETAGRDTDAEIRIGFPGLSKASRCDLVERVLDAVPLENNQIRARIGANAIATYRLE